METDVLGLLTLFIDALRGGNWLLAIPIGLMLLLWALRKWVFPLAATRFPFVYDKRVTLGLAALLPALGAVVTALVAGQPFTWALVGSAVTAGLGGGGPLGGGEKREQARGPR